MPVSIPSVRLAGELVQELLDGMVKLAGGVLAGMDGFKALAEASRSMVLLPGVSRVMRAKNPIGSMICRMGSSTLISRRCAMRRQTDPAALGETGR